MNRLIIQAKYNLKNTNNYAEITRLSKNKGILHHRLDKKINVAFMHCYNDKTSKICSGIWNDVESCLKDIDNVNQEILIHTWYLNIDESEYS